MMQSSNPSRETFLCGAGILPALGCRQDACTTNSRLQTPTPTRSAFTLIEMIVVIAIISIIVGLVLPGAAAMWKQRNEAGTINLVRGVLESARSQARRLGERGVLFYVDPIDNVQRIAFIEAEPPNTPDAVGNDFDRLECEAVTGKTDCITAPMAVYRFRVASDKVYTVPPPYRVAPLQALQWAGCIDANNPDPCKNEAFPTANLTTLTTKLGTDRFLPDDGPDMMKPVRQRNFFTIVFDRSGAIVVGRNVLIHDRNAANIAKPVGDKTQLPVSGLLATKEYIGGDGLPADIGPSNSGSTYGLSNMVIHVNGYAANFPSVAGLVVYDDSTVEGLGGDAETAGTLLVGELLDNGRPMYVSRQTGDIILGEKGR